MHACLRGNRVVAAVHGSNITKLLHVEERTRVNLGGNAQTNGTNSNQGRQNHFAFLPFDVVLCLCGVVADQLVLNRFVVVCAVRNSRGQELGS